MAWTYPVRAWAFNIIQHHQYGKHGEGLEAGGVVNAMQARERPILNGAVLAGLERPVAVKGRTGALSLAFLRRGPTSREERSFRSGSLVHARGRIAGPLTSSHPGALRPSLLSRRSMGNERELHIIVLFGAGRLCLAYPEHLRPADGARALGRRASVLHGYGLGALHLSLGPALYAVGFHLIPPKYCARYIVNSWNSNFYNSEAQFYPIRLRTAVNGVIRPRDGRIAAGQW